MYINDYIKEKRKEKEITQEQLGNLLGLQQYTISKWETNKEEIKKEYIPDICNILDIDSYHLMHILMDDIFLSPNICKDLNEIFNNKSELKETIKFVLEENTKIQIIMNNCMNYIKKNIEDLTDFTIKHNLNPYETREELLNKYIINIKELVHNFEYNKDKKYEIYGDNILLKLLNALIILSKKENEELYSFLCLMIKMHKSFLMNINQINSKDYCIYHNSKNLNLKEKEEIFIFNNLDIIIHRIESNKEQFKYENITEKEIILDIICCTIMNKYYPSDAFAGYKMNIRNIVHYSERFLNYRNEQYKNNYYSTSILVNTYKDKTYSHSKKNDSRPFQNERFIKDLSYLQICKEYNISEEDIKTFIKDMSLAYFY